MTDLLATVTLSIRITLRHYNVLARAYDRSDISPCHCSKFFCQKHSGLTILKTLKNKVEFTNYVKISPPILFDPEIKTPLCLFLKNWLANNTIQYI